MYKLLTALRSTTWTQLACPILLCCLGKSSDFRFFILGKSSIEIIYIIGNSLVTTKWLKCHYSEILEGNGKSVCFLKPVELQFGYQHKQKNSNTILKAVRVRQFMTIVCLHMNSCWQASLSLIGVIIFMHHSECCIEPLAIGGVGVMACYTGLHLSFGVVAWTYMILKKNFTTPRWVPFTQLFPHSADVKGRGLDSPYYFPIILYSTEVIWFQWVICSTVQVPLRKSFTYSMRNIFSCSFLSWCMQICLRWWAAVYVWRWERQTLRKSVILEKYEICSGCCMLPRESKYDSTVHKSSFLLQKNKN